MPGTPATGSVYFGFHVPSDSPYNKWDSAKRMSVKQKVNTEIKGKTSINRRDELNSLAISTQPGGTIEETDVRKIMKDALDRTHKGMPGFASDSHAISLAVPVGGGIGTGGEEPDPDHITYIYVGTRRLCIHGYGLTVKANADDNAATVPWTVQEDGHDFAIQANLQWGSAADAGGSANVVSDGGFTSADSGGPVTPGG